MGGRLSKTNDTEPARKVPVVERGEGVTSKGRSHLPNNSESAKHGYRGENPSQLAPVIGIDLGTTNSCVGVFRNGRFDIIPNSHGNRTTPSLVSFIEDEASPLVGDAAKSYLTRNPTGTLFNVLRILGRKSDDPVFQTDKSSFPFNVIDEGGWPKVRIVHQGEEKSYYPEEILSILFSYMKVMAETHLGVVVSAAVVAVPGCFNHAKQQAITCAAGMAGLNVHRIMAAPSCAAIAYGIDKTFDGMRVHPILVFDLGGGTCDASIVTIEDQVYEVKSISGDTHLGGEDFNARMVNHFIDDFRKEYGEDISTNKKALCRLRKACEEAKKMLSSANEARIDIDQLYEGIDYHAKIKRETFEDMNTDLFEDALKPVKKAVADACVHQFCVKDDDEEISEVVLVGGSTRIRKIQELLREYFDGKKLNLSLNPDEAVCYGAAVYAAILSGDKSLNIEDMLLLPVIPFPIGIEAVGGVMSPLIKGNRTFPAKQYATLTTHMDNQSSIMIKIYEGDQENACENTLMSMIEVTGISRAPRGVPRIDVALDIWQDKITFVLITDDDSENVITLTNAMGTTEVQYSHFQIAGTKDKSKEPVHKINIEVDC